MELFYETEAVNSAQVIYSSALFKCVRFTAFARFALCRTVRNRQNNGRKTKFVSLGRSRGSLFRRFAPYTQTKKALKNAVFQCFFCTLFYLVTQLSERGHTICYAILCDPSVFVSFYGFTKHHISCR